MSWPQELSMLNKSRRSYLGEYWAVNLLWAQCFFLGVGGVSLLIAAIFPGFHPLRWVVPFLAASIFLARRIAKRPGSLEIARSLDRELGSFERVQTMVENQGQRGMVLERFRQETREYFMSNPPKRRINMGKFLAPGAMLVICALVMTTAILVAPGLAEKALARGELEEQRQQAIEDIQEILKLLPEDNDLLGDLVEELKLLQEQVEAAKDIQELEMLLGEAAEAVAAQAEAMESLEAAVAQLQELLDSMSPEELAQEIAQDPTEFNQRLNELAQNLPQGHQGQEKFQLDGDVSPTDLEELAQKLAKLNPSSAAGELDQALSQIGQGSQTPDVGLGEPGQGTGDAGDGAGIGDGDGDGDGENGQGTGDQGGETGGGQGGEAPGESQEPGGGAGTGGGGNTPQQFVHIPGQGEVVLGGEGDQGEFTLRDLIRANPSLGQDYTSYFAGYRQRALSSLVRGEIPRPLEDYVRSYFEAISPEGGN